MVGGLALIEVPCPIDEGTGVITGAKGLKVTGVEGELVDWEQYELGCGLLWVDFTYAVKISVVNETTTPRHGGILVKFYDPETALEREVVEQIFAGEGGQAARELGLEFLGTPVERIPIFVKIPAETAETIEEIVVFTSEYLLNAGETHNILADVSGQIVCPYCDGTGKVPIIEWLRIKANVQ